MSIWRIQTKTSKGDIAEYCLRNKIAAVGWSLTEYSNRSEFFNLNFCDYCEYADKIYNSYDSVIRLANYIKENDIIWMRKDGKYYFARVKSTSKWKFNNELDAVELDACNQLSDIEWIENGLDESEVPGALTTAFIRGSTFQRINKAGICEFSELIYNQMCDSGFKYSRTIKLDKDVFYSLISPSDCEDLLCMWLFKENKYVCIPSTNKISTEKYECVLIDSNTGNHIYIQVKNGEINLNTDDYYSLVKSTENKVYLLTTKGKIENINKYDNVIAVNPDILFEFAINEENTKIIPPNIKYWIEFAGGYYNGIDKKGIVFDTDSKIDGHEEYMFANNVVAAWGKAYRYIKSFSKGDYVFYYKKGYGIIAIGIINSEKPRKIESGLEYDVKILVSPLYDNNKKPLAFISANELKQIINKSFYFASTRKVPFLDEKESKILVDILKNKGH